MLILNQKSFAVLLLGKTITILYMLSYKTSKCKGNWDILIFTYCNVNNHHILRCFRIDSILWFDSMRYVDSIFFTQSIYSLQHKVDVTNMSTFCQGFRVGGDQSLQGRFPWCTHFYTPLTWKNIYTYCDFDKLFQILLKLEIKPFKFLVFIHT